MKKRCENYVSLI